jgi:hypothetical protein
MVAAESGERGGGAGACDGRSRGSAAIFLGFDAASHDHGTVIARAGAAPLGLTPTDIG